MSTGYVRLTLPGGERVLEHRWIWEQANGPIPDGGIIHHVNHDKRDNRLENLVLVENVAAHNRAHGGTLRESYTRTMAVCHPDEPNRGRGLCLSCYMKERRGTLNRLLPVLAAEPGVLMPRGTPAAPLMTVEMTQQCPDHREVAERPGQPRRVMRPRQEPRQPPGD